MPLFVIMHIIFFLIQCGVTITMQNLVIARLNKSIQIILNIAHLLL